VGIRAGLSPTRYRTTIPLTSNPKPYVTVPAAPTDKTVAVHI